MRKMKKHRIYSGNLMARNHLTDHRVDEGIKT
jgi:hypothetical protein